MSKEKNLISMLAKLVCLSPLIGALFMWKYIPDKVVIHFDVYGNPNLQASKFFAFILTPFLFLIIHHFILYLYKNHRRIFGMDNLSINYYYVLAPVASIIVFLVTLRYAIL